jgi:uncharacterized repeat protein (TIGR03803 family)
MGRWGQPIGIVEGSPGVFYSTAGTPQPVAFSITTQGTKTFLASFPNTDIQAPLASASNQRFYSSYSPNYTAFSVGSTPGKDLYPNQATAPGFTQNLPDGTLLAVAAAQTFYLAKGDTAGTVTPIYAFPSGTYLPHTAIYASDGNYYGVAMLQNASGYVYRVTTSGALTTLFSFPAVTFTGGPRYVPLLQAGDGNLYGATPYGGANGTGTIYRLTLSGQYTLLYTFPKGLDYNPTAMLQASDGNLYGATWGLNGSSQLFKVTTSGQYTQLYSMTSTGCLCLLTQGSDGIIYGTAQAGGPVGAGAVFALDAGLPKPAPQAIEFGPQHGPVGTRIRIWGSNMLAATVQFGSVPATAVSTSGPNYVWVTVPAGAVSGPVTVTTPGGTSTTRASFFVE